MYRGIRFILFAMYVVLSPSALADSETTTRFSPFVFVQRMYLIDESPGVAVVEGWGTAYQLVPEDNTTCLPRVVVDGDLLQYPSEDAINTSTYVTFTFEANDMLVNGHHTIRPKLALRFLGESVAVLILDPEDVSCDDFLGAPAETLPIAGGEPPVTWVLHARTRMESNTLESVRPLADDEVSREVFGVFLPIKPDVALMNGHGSPYVLTNLSLTTNYGYGVLSSSRTPTFVRDLMPASGDATRVLLSSFR